MTIQTVYYELKSALKKTAQLALLEAIKESFNGLVYPIGDMNHFVELWEAVHPAEQGKPNTTRYPDAYLERLNELENDAGGWYIADPVFRKFDFLEHERWREAMVRIKRWKQEREKREKQ